jgi:2-oxoglutarate ferredoxin oxidoreductase subunit gamma
MAACIFSEKNAVQTQSYGPESRGGSCKSEVVIADEEIDFPKVYNPDIIMIMSQEAYHKYATNVKKGSVILVDPDMVTDRDDPTDVKVFDIPAMKMAKELGKTIVANVVMLGALTAITKIVTPEAMKNAIFRNIPKGTEDTNTEAFEKGFQYGSKLLE